MFRFSKRLASFFSTSSVTSAHVRTSEYQIAQTMQHTSSLPKPDPWSVEAVIDGLPANTTKFSLTEKPESPLQFFHYLERLKIEKREGWRRFGISTGESIADHQWRMALIAMQAPKSLSDRVDMFKCVRLCLVHDIAEGLVGDLTPVDGVPKEEKSRRESSVVDGLLKNSLLSRWNGGTNGAALSADWWEYEKGQTLEAKFVKDVDKIELMLQMVEYERTYDMLDLVIVLIDVYESWTDVQQSEFSRVQERLHLDEMKQLASEITEERRKLWESRNKQPREDTVTTTVQQQQDQYYGDDGKQMNGVAH